MGGWLLVTAAVFSFSSGIIHTYYTVALAPAIAALVAIGAVMLWQERGHLWRGFSPPARSRAPPAGRTSCSSGRRASKRG